MVYSESDAGKDPVGACFLICVLVANWQFRKCAKFRPIDAFSVSNLTIHKFPRNGVAVTTCRGMIYAIGGHDGDQELKSAER